MNLVPGATYVPLSPALLGQRPRRRKGRGACAHVAVSESARLVPSSSAADWHIYIPRNGPNFYQFIDLDLVCYASLNGNGSLVAWETQGGVHNVETEPWSDFQLLTQAHIMRYLNQSEGIPLQVMPNSRPESRGLGYHKLGIDPWRVAGGELWSSSRGKVCPGLRKIAQIQDVITLAKMGNQPVPVPPKEGVFTLASAQEINAVSDAVANRGIGKNPDGTSMEAWEAWSAAALKADEAVRLGKDNAAKLDAILAKLNG